MFALYHDYKTIIDRGLLTVFTVDNCPDCSTLIEHLNDTQKPYHIVNCSNEKPQFRTYLVANNYICEGQSFNYPLLIKKHRFVDFSAYEVLPGHVLYTIYDDQQ